MARAPDRVIQSVAAGMGQSDVVGVGVGGVDDEVVAGEVDGDDPSFALEPLVPLESPARSEPVGDVPPLSVVVEASSFFVDDPPSTVESSPAFAAAPDDTVARRSFFAQPEPLKWTAAAVMALRIGPSPHNGHAPGGSPWTPWITSKRRPHAAQT